MWERTVLSHIVPKCPQGLHKLLKLENNGSKLGISLITAPAPASSSKKVNIQSKDTKFLFHTDNVPCGREV